MSARNGGELIEISTAVQWALDEGAPVVALETSVLAQGLPEPGNGEAAERMEAAVREGGAEPAWIWVGEGRLRIGASPADLERLMRGPAAKVARRDIAAVVAGGGLGGTTVSAALWTAARIGVEVFATGGIGGVHPGGGDVSADLIELARTGGTVVCSGPKSILDPAATLERLEELGVAVVGYGASSLPFFLARDSGLPLEHRAESPGDVAAAARARRSLGLPGALLVCQPCPVEDALDAGEVAEAVERCRARAVEQAVSGKELTPALLRCIGEETGGASLRANLALLEANARLAAQVAALLQAFVT